MLPSDAGIRWLRHDSRTLIYQSCLNWITSFVGTASLAGFTSSRLQGDSMAHCIKLHNKSYSSINSESHASFEIGLLTYGDFISTFKANSSSGRPFQLIGIHTLHSQYVIGMSLSMIHFIFTLIEIRKLKCNILLKGKNHKEIFKRKKKKNCC